MSKLKELARAIEHPVRKKIMKYLSEKELNVTQLRKKLRVEQSQTSAHLAILRRSKIVVTKREGKKVYYAIDLSNNILEKYNEFQNSL